VLQRFGHGAQVVSFIVLLEEKRQMLQGFFGSALAQQGIAYLEPAHQVVGMKRNIRSQVFDGLVHQSEKIITAGQRLTGGGALEPMQRLAEHG
jgi:hypothetical protein